MTSRWREPETQDQPSEAEPGGAPDLVKYCPRCGQPMPAESQICHYCLTNLGDVPAAPFEPPPPEPEPPIPWRYIRRVGRRRWLQLFVLVVVAGLVYTQCFWPAPSRDAASGSRSLATGPAVWAAAGGNIGSTRITEASPPLHGDTAWVRRLDSELTAALVADERAIYAAHRDALLVAYSTADGSELWRFPVPGQLDESPAIAGDTVYATLRSGRLVTLEAHSGDLRWASDTGQDLLSGPMVVDGVVWVGGRGVMLAYDAETGELLGADATGDSVLAVGGPAVGDERVVARSWRRLHFFNIETGRHEFFARFFRPKYLTAGHGIVIGVSDLWMLAFDEDVGQPWWEGLRAAWFWADLWGVAPQTPNQPFRWAERMDCPPLALVLQPDQVIVSCEDGRVAAASLESGAYRWERGGAPLADSPVLIAEGLLLFEESALVLVDPASGEEIDRRTLEGISLSQALVTSGGIYIVTADGELLALR